MDMGEKNETTFVAVDCLDGNPDVSRFGVLPQGEEQARDRLEEWTVIDNDTDN